METRIMSTYREEFSLPTSRQHILDHPSTKFAALFTDEKKISPLWTKVSASPFEKRSQLIGGYGKKLQKTSISIDAPTAFVNPDRVPIPSNKMDRLTASIIRTPKTLDSSKVLPGGESIAIARRNAVPSKIRKLCFQKMTLLDDVVPAKINESIVWSGR